MMLDLYIDPPHYRGKPALLCGIHRDNEGADRVRGRWEMREGEVRGGRREKRGGRRERGENWAKREGEKRGKFGRAALRREEGDKAAGLGR